MSDEESEKKPNEALGDYWKANIALIGFLLVLWFIVSYGFGILFVESMNNWSIGSLPLGFWFAHQGSIFVFVLLVFVYAWGMDYLRDRYHEQTRENNNES
jgi:putative solute:sodium symporter small subunit